MTTGQVESQASLVQDIYPLSPTQQGMLFHSLLDPAAGAYVVQVGFTLGGELDRSAFDSAWRTLQARHDVLRTAFAWERLEQPMQVVGREADLPIDEVDLRDLSTAAQDSEMLQWLQQDRVRGFDLRRAPLMRVTLFQLAPARVRVVWTYHHLLLDGWSLPLLLHEWIACYLAAEQGLQASLAPALPYRDYIAWLQQQDRSRALAFWRDELRGFSSPTPLTLSPADRQAESTRARLSHFVDTATTRMLQDFARRERLTLSTLLQGAWSLLLHRYSGERDIVFGLARSGRPTALPQSGQRVGLFLNLLPMRVQLADETPVTQWLAEIQRRQLAQQDFEYAALRDVHDVSEISAALPLFESILVFENYPTAPGERLGENRLALSDIDVSERTNYPLNLYAAVDGQLELRALFAGDRFAADAIERLLRHLQTLLSDIAASPGRTLGELPTLSPDDFVAAHVLPNQTSDDTQRVALHAAVARHAADKPDHDAVVCRGQTLSYRQLDRQANRLANYLVARGVTAGSTIGVCVTRSLAMPVALLAVMRCGCAYVPMDAGYPADRLRHIVDDAGMAHIIVDTVTRDRLPVEPGMLIDVDAERDTIARYFDDDVRAAPERGELAYLIYTSGSTGLPKGVEISHANLDNLLASMSERLAFDAGKRLLAVTTLAFDIATLELLMPLLNGGCLVIADDEEVRDGEQLAALLTAQAIDVMQATPSTWRLLLETGWSGRSALQVLCGGEALDAALARELLPRCDELWNLYGPTETTIWSAALHVTAELAEEDTIPIGGALANTVLHVLDAQQRPLPPGVPGELYIGGQGVGHGYHGRGALTTERFVSNPLPADPRLPDAPRLYRTGDQVRQREDGLYAFLGRLDNQIKLRGYRIELGDIEAALLSHDDVERACVELVNNDTPGARLVAVYCPRPGSDRDDTAALEQGLRDHLAACLPAYMLPSVFQRVESLPLTPNGKLDRAAVRRMDFAVGSGGGAPRTPIEKTLAEIWQALLGGGSIGPDDNFFEIGGHSLLIVKAQALVRERLDVELAMTDLFRYPTLATLAGHIAQLRERSGEDAAAVDDGAEERLNAGRARRQAQRARRRRDTLPQTL